MKLTLLKKCLAAVAGFLLLGAGQARALHLEFGTETGAAINFHGASHTFDFSNGGSGYAFNITSVSDGFTGVGVNSATGLLGQITGSYSIGTVTNIGFDHAFVTGSGVFSINDGAGFDFTSDVTWVDLATIGTGSTINVGGTLNMSNFNYGGTNADLLALTAAATASNVITFQFTPAVSLTALRNNGEHTTSFSGSVQTLSTPDGGSMLAMFGAGLLATGALRRKLKKA